MVQDFIHPQLDLLKIYVNVRGLALLWCVLSLYILEPLPCIPGLGHLGSSIRIMASLGSPRNKGIGDIGVTIILGFCRDHGKENGNCYSCLASKIRTSVFPIFIMFFHQSNHPTCGGPSGTKRITVPQKPLCFFSKPWP